MWPYQSLSEEQNTLAVRRRYPEKASAPQGLLRAV